MGGELTLCLVVPGRRADGGGGGRLVLWARAGAVAPAGEDRGGGAGVAGLAGADRSASRRGSQGARPRRGRVDLAAGAAAADGVGLPSLLPDRAASGRRCGNWRRWRRGWA